MAVSKSKKVEILSELVEKVKQAKSIGFVMTTEMTVQNFSELRKELRTVQTSYTLAKKTLIAKAVKQVLNIDIDLESLPGQVGMVCSNQDAIAGLGKVNDFIPKAKKGKQDRMFWVASIFEGKFRGQDETMAIASMPSRETLLSRLVGSMQSPLSSLARFFDGASKELQTAGKEKVGQLEGKKAE